MYEHDEGIVDCIKIQSIILHSLSKTVGADPLEFCGELGGFHNNISIHL